MTFLEICKRVRQISGLSGDGPVSVEGQTDIMQRIVDWVKDAEVDILQSKEHWTFLRKIASGNLVVGTFRYPVDMLNLSATRKLNRAFVDGSPLEILEYQDWLDRIVELKKEAVGSSPQFITLTQDQRLELWPTPQKASEITIDYIAKPIFMKGNLDKSHIPEDYHYSIVHRALMFYADYEEDMYRYQRSQAEFDKWMANMYVEYLPKLQLNRGGLCG